MKVVHASRLHCLYMRKRGRTDRPVCLRLRTDRARADETAARLGYQAEFSGGLFLRESAQASHCPALPARAGFALHESNRCLRLKNPDAWPIALEEKDRRFFHHARRLHPAHANESAAPRARREES